MYKLGLAALLSLLTLISSSTTLLAHDGHTTYHYDAIECNGKKIPHFWVGVLKVFAHKLYLKCVIDGTTITLKGNLDTRPLAQPAHPSPTTSPHSPPPAPAAHASTQPPSNPKPIPSLPPSGSQPNQYWHEPANHDGLNVHEHGDRPPQWAQDFSQKNFGHPVMFGGDEATPNENILKHQAYKGFLMQASGVDLYFRYHNMSNPHDRSGPFHSYEVYAKDDSGNISFWQGWEFVGYPEHRDQRMTRRNEQPGHDNINGIDWPGRSQFIVSGSDLIDWKNYLRCEQWYKHAGLWSWDVSVTICGASTLYSVDEHKTDVANPATWHLTGDVGGNRRLEVSHYGPANPAVGGADLPFDRWFCVKKLPNENRAMGWTPTWDVSGAVSGPAACETGWLPQYVAGSFPKKGVYFETGNTATKDFPTPGVTVPN